MQHRSLTRALVAFGLARVPKTMGLTKVLKILAVAGSAALTLAGCSGTSVQLSSKRMCEAAGGTYAGTTCNAGSASPRTAKQMCDAHGGTYVPDLDACQVGGMK